MKLTAAQIEALRHMIACDGYGQVGCAPLRQPTVDTLRRLGLTEHDRIESHSEAFGYNFGRYTEWRTVSTAIERITDAGRQAIADLDRAGTPAQRKVTFEANDGSIEHCLLTANDGRPYGDYYVYDAIALDFGDAAPVMRDALKPGTPTVEVQFPHGHPRRRYANVAAAKRAIIRAAQ